MASTVKMVLVNGGFLMVVNSRLFVPNLWRIYGDGVGTHSPPSGPNFFIYMQFL